MAGRSAVAATQYWDPNGASALGGTGNWDTTSANWSSGNVPTATPTPWTNGNTAIFSTAGGTVTIAAGGVDAAGLTVNVSGYTIAGGPLTLDGVTPVVAFGTTGAATTDTISSVIAGSGSLTGVSFTGQSGSTAAGSTIALTGQNTYSGTSTFTSCILNFNTLANTNAASSVGTKGNVELVGNMQVYYTGTGGATDRLWQSNGSSYTYLYADATGGGSVAFNATGSAVVGTGNRSLFLNGTSGTNTFAEQIGDLSGGTTKLTVNTVSGFSWALTGANTYTGGTTLNTGTINVNQAASLGAGTVTVAPSSASIASDVINATAGLTLANPIVITAATGSTAYFRNTTAAGAGSTFNVSGAISGAGGVQVQTASSSSFGPIEFSNDTSSFTGLFNTGGGVIAFTSVGNAGAPSALGSGTSAYLLSNATNAVVFQYLGTASTSTTRSINWAGTTGGLSLDASGTGTVQYLATTALRSGAGNATLTLTGSNAGANVLAQTVTDGVGSGVTAVNKTGAGTWVLNAPNTYTGATTITGGTLVANGSSGSATGTSPVTVTSTGVLAGTASAGTVLVTSGGKVTAGSGATAADSIGTLTTGVQTWNASGGYVAKTDGTSADQLVMGGLSIAASSTAAPFTVTVVGTGAGATLSTVPITIAIDKSTNVGVFQNAIAANLLTIATSNLTVPAGYGATLSESDSGGTELLQFLATPTATPEPASLMMLAAAGVPLLAGRRRRTGGRP
jgi:fibronectin-binding autotransporter adhesin